ncbi:hypothetical protein D3C76_1386760 [compost metagenome]
MPGNRDKPGGEYDAGTVLQKPSFGHVDMLFLNQNILSVFLQNWSPTVSAEPVYENLGDDPADDAE